MVNTYGHLDNPDPLSIFNMRTKMFESNPGISFRIKELGCLASTQKYLFILGGAISYAPLSKLEILDLSMLQWIDNAPSMNFNRSEFGCITHPHTNQLFAIGGNTDGPALLDSIETLSIIEVANITNYKWTVFPSRLIHKTAYLRSIVHRNYILVIAGSTESSRWSSEIQVIDVVSKKVRSGGDINYRAYNVAPIIADGHVYVFGGRTDGGATDRWQYGVLLSI